MKRNLKGKKKPVFKIVFLSLLTLVLISSGILSCSNNDSIDDTQQKLFTQEPKATQAVKEYPIPQEMIGKWESIMQNDCYGYEFLQDGTLKYLSQHLNDAIIEEVYSYEFIDETTVMLDGDTYNTITVIINDQDIMLCDIDNGEISNTFWKKEAFGFNPVYTGDEDWIVSDYIQGRWKGQYDDTVYGFEFFEDGTLELYTRAEDNKPEINTFTYEIVDSKNLKIESMPEMQIDYKNDIPEMKISWNYFWDDFSIICERTLWLPTDKGYQATLDKSDMVKNLDVYIENKTWESTGNTYMPEATVNLAGYPIEFYVTEGSNTIKFVDGLIHTGSSESVYISDPGGYFTNAFDSESMPHYGKVYHTRDVYYVKNDMLYSYMALDDVPCSNIIEYMRVE